ncbi:DivIVA domain-containing protein [Desulfosediminicola flagellatus]|uniref:DivIVA domain-containing protein n=1 Tax=Desulfosediminicola flagellatus TaxID=2569541 RepID=UPI0010AB80B5|nr:DivIVA domain-containing protein [Desulfosediminicola flagellatus]
MSITPQAIKDQEFQVKFRGYDSIEVKAYLELLAEEFFELHELRRKQEEEYAELYEENQALKQEKDSLVEEGREQVERSVASVQEFQEKDEAIAVLEEKVAELQTKIEGSEQEKTLQQEAWERQESELREEIDRLKEGLDDKQTAVSETSSEAEKLRAQIEILEAQINELKQEEIDFKSTIIAAQKFSDDLRAKSQEESARLLEQARDEVETFRREAEEELASLPVQIEKLQKKKAQVREDLRAVLNSYLEQLDVATDVAAVDNDEDLSDLFQSISLNGDDIDTDAAEKVSVD